MVKTHAVFRLCVEDNTQALSPMFPLSVIHIPPPPVPTACHREGLVSGRRLLQVRVRKHVSVGCMGSVWGVHGGAWGRMGCTVNTWIYADGAAVRTLVYRRAMVSTYHYLPLQLYLRLKHPPHLSLSLSPYFNLDGNAMVFNISSMRRRSAMSLPMEK